MFHASILLMKRACGCAIIRQIPNREKDSITKKLSDRSAQIHNGTGPEVYIKRRKLNLKYLLICEKQLSILSPYARTGIRNNLPGFINVPALKTAKVSAAHVLNGVIMQGFSSDSGKSVFRLS